MSIREEIRSRLKQSIFNSSPARCAHPAGSKRPGSQTVTLFFSCKNKPVSRRSTPPTFLWDFCVSTTGRETASSYPKNKKNIAVGLWARPSTTICSRVRRLCPSGAPPPTRTTPRHLKRGSPSRRDTLSTSTPTSPCQRFDSIVAIIVATSFFVRCDECRMVALAILFVSSLGVREISGRVILQLQNTNDLAALACTTAQKAELPRSEPQDSRIGALTLRPAYLERVMAATTVGLHPFEFQSL